MKLKTHKGTKKRIKLSGSGKAQRRKAAKNHLLVHKSKAAKRQKSKALCACDAKKLQQLLPNS